MTLTLDDIGGLLRRTFRTPQEAASEVLALGIPRDALWLLVASVIVLSSLAGHVFTMLSALIMPEVVAESALSLNIFTTVAVQAGFLFVMIFMVQAVGRAVGGTAQMSETIVLMCWLQFVMLCVSVVTSLIGLLIPPLTLPAMVAQIGITLWLLSNFVAVLHGFRSVSRVFWMILLSIFVLSIITAFVLSAFGITPPLQGTT